MHSPYSRNFNPVFLGPPSFTHVPPLLLIDSSLKLFYHNLNTLVKISSSAQHKAAWLADRAVYGRGSIRGVMALYRLHHTAGLPSKGEQPQVQQPWHSPSVVITALAARVPALRWEGIEVPEVSSLWP